MLVPSRELLGLPVISLEEGQQLGVVRELVVDKEDISIAAIIFSPKGFLKESRVLPFNRVHSIGSHAVTIAKITDVDKSWSQQLSRLTRRSLEGTRVISEQGNAIGTVDDLVINTETGKIVFLELSGKLIEGILRKQASLAAEFIKTMGKDVVVVAKFAESSLVFTENRIHHKLKNVGDSTVKALETTWHKTRKLGKIIPLFNPGEQDSKNKNQADNPSQDNEDNKKPEER